MAEQYYKAESRKEWYSTKEGNLSIEELNCGAIMRIADATEKMAQRHTDLIRERDNFERWYRQEQRANERLCRQLAATKGQITKLKKRLTIAQTQAFGGDPASVAFKSKEQCNG